MKGRTQYHEIWEKYFTLPWDIKYLDEKSKMPIDEFLYGIDYKKTEKKIIKNSTKSCETASDYTEELSKIFNFQLNDILNAEKLAKIVISQKTSTNFKYAIEYIFRGYIVFSKMLSQLIDNDISQNSNQLFDNESWNSIRFIYESLLIHSSSQEIVDDFIDAIDPILISYFQFSDKILTLPNDNCIKMSLIYLIENLIQIISSNSTFSIEKIIDFLNKIFYNWIKGIEKLDVNEPFYNAYNLQYVPKLISISEKLNLQLKLQISRVISQFFSFYDKIEQNDYFISNGINNLQLLSLIVDELDNDSHRNGLYEFIFYSTTFYFDSSKINSQSRNYFSENEKSLSYFTPEEYFQEHEIIDIQKINFHINMKYLKNIIPLFQNIISKSLFTNEIIYYIISRSNNLDFEQSKKFYLIFISAISTVKNVSSDNISDLFKLYSIKNLFTIPHGGLHQLLLDNTFALLLNSIIINNDICETLFTNLFRICSTNFESILIFMPLLRSILKDNYYRKTNYFIIHWLKQDSLCNNIHVNLNNPKYQFQIDEMISFIQVVSIIYPSDIFTSGFMFPVFLGFVTKERYQSISLSWIKYSFNSLASIGSNLKLFENIIAIISVVLEKTMNDNDDKYFIQLSDKLVQILNETVSKFSIDVTLMFSNWNLLMSFASLPQKTNDLSTFKNVTSFLFCLDKQSNHKIEHLITLDSIVFSCLKDSFKNFKLDEELIEILLSFCMNKKVQINFGSSILTIQNRIALKMLIEIAKDTEFEGLILDDLVQLCNQSTTNIFECFLIDIINYTLERALKKDLRVQAIQLYQIVSSTFFSPISLYETFKALYCTSLNRRSNYHQMILDCFLRLILENRPNPVSRFFHFNGIKTGITGPAIPSNLTQNWSFITTLRMDTKTSLEDPLLCLIDESNYHFLFSFIDDELVFSYNLQSSSKKIPRMQSEPNPIKEGDSSSSSTLIKNFQDSSKRKVFQLRSNSLFQIFQNFKFSKHVWYQILIVFTSRDILLYVNGSQVSSIKLKKIQQLNGNVLAKIGNFKTDSFSGDMGPAFFLKNNGINSENIEQIINGYQKSAETSFNKLPSTILCYDPYNASDNEINDVFQNEGPAILIGSSVQFGSTLSSVIQHCGTFQCFLPLFSIVDHPCIDDSADILHLYSLSSIDSTEVSLDDNDDDNNSNENEIKIDNENENNNKNDKSSEFKYRRTSSLNSSFGIIKIADDDDDESRSKDGNKSVDDQIFHTLLVILKMILEISPEMEKNFESIGGFQLLAGLFAPFTPESFTIYVPHDLEEIYFSLKSESLKHQMAEFIWLNFDLWSAFSTQLQNRFFNYELKQAFSVDPKPFNFSTYDFLLYQIQTYDITSRDNSKSLLNSNESEIKDIKSSQWDFFGKLFKPNTATIWFILFILSYNENIDCRDNAFKLFNKLLIEKNNVMLDSLIILSKIDNYLLILDKENPGNFLHFIYLLGKLQKEDKNSLKIHFEFQKAVLGSAALIDFEKSNSSDLFCDCSNYTFTNTGFNCTEFIPLLSLLSTYADKKDIQNTYSIFSLAIANDFPSINKFAENIKGWPFYFFIFSNNADDISTLLSNFICRNPRNIKFLLDFFYFIQITMKIDTFPMLTKIFASILSKYSDYNVVFIILNVILFQIKTDFDDQLTTNEKLSKEEINALHKSFQSLKIPNIRIEFDPKFDENLYKIIEEIFIIQFPKQTFTFRSDFVLESFEIYSYLLSIRIIKTRNFALFKDYLTKKEDFIEKSLVNQNIIDISQSLIDNVYLQVRNSEDFIQYNQELKYEETINNKLNEKTVFDDYNSFIQKVNDYSKVYDLQQFIDNIALMSDSLKDCIKIVKSINPNANDAFRDAYKNTLQNCKHSRSIVEQYNIKLAQSFIRESTSNGGPLSTTPPESVKWTWTIRTDLLFRPSFYRVNLYFSNHAKAARIRDKMKHDLNSDKIIPFKRVLDQKVSLSNNKSSNSNLIGNSKAIASYNVIDMTISIRYFGRLSIIDDRIFFEGNAFSDGFGTPFKNSENAGDKNAIYDEQSRKTKFIEIPLDSVEFIFYRAFLYEDIACEIYTNLNKSYFFIFNSKENRNEFMSAVKKELDDHTPTQILKTVFSRRIKRPRNSKDGKFDFFGLCRKATGCHIQNISSQELVSKSGIIEAWQNRKISNFMYLFLLNIIAGRSLNDLSKYMVYPWIFSDYTSETIDISNPDVYRKLDLPLGALNENRLNLIKDFLQDTFDKTEYCLYRTHYSSAAFVIGYLVRTEPFATLHIILQGGMFDHSDRLFSSIENTWASVSSQMNDFRELIPQFYCDPHFLVNENGFDLGKKMNGNDVSNVDLPKWANNSAYKFIEIMRAGIESEYVSSNINHWIDLIFGVYQKSVEKNNLFHLFSYPDCLQSPLITEDYQMQMAKYHGINFGTCCDQIFTQNHPVRNPSTSLLKKQLSDKFKFSSNDVFYFDKGYILTKSGFLVFFTPNPSIINLQIQLKEMKFSSKIAISKKHGLIFLVSRSGAFMSVISFKGEKATEISRVSHFGSSILCLEVVDSQCVLTGGSDCSIHIWSLPNIDLVGRMSFQSRSVTSLSCCHEIDLVASLDENHQVWCSSIDHQRFVNTFQVQCPKDSINQVLATKNGFIFVSTSCRYSNANDNESSENFCMNVFDTRGNMIKKIPLNSFVVKMREMYLNHSISLVVASLDNMSLIVIRTLDLEIVETISAYKIVPYLFSVDSDQKEIFFICRSDEGDCLKSHSINYQ